MSPQITIRVLRFLALMPALTLHEFAHAYSAYRFGDPTPQMDGRISLNPLDHLDPIGTLMILFAPIGWAKPVRINPHNLRDPARHMMMSTACGPLANIAQGTLWAVLLRVILEVSPGSVPGNFLVAFVVMAVILNFALATFNLIPLGVLDGHEILQYFLPYPQKARYHEFNQRYGMALLIGLILVSAFMGVPVFHYLFWPAFSYAELIVGVPLYGILGLALGA